MIEWTHGNSDNYKGCGYPCFIEQHATGDTCTQKSEKQGRCNRQPIYHDGTGIRAGDVRASGSKGKDHHFKERRAVKL